MILANDLRKLAHSASSQVASCKYELQKHQGFPKASRSITTFSASGHSGAVPRTAKQRFRVVRNDRYCVINRHAHAQALDLAR